MHKNKQNNKIYIGITCRSINTRWQKGEGYKYNTHFYRSIQKYGWDAFEHKILIHGLTKQQAQNWETRLIKYYKCNNPKFGYNLTSGGELNTPNTSIRMKISISKLGGKNPQAKKVMCLKDYCVYSSIKECAKAYSLRADTIQRSCANYRKVKKVNDSFVYLEDYENCNTQQKVNLLKEYKNFLYKDYIYSILDGKIFVNKKQCAEYYALQQQTITSHCLNHTSNPKFIYYINYLKLNKKEQKNLLNNYLQGVAETQQHTILKACQAQRKNKIPWNKGRKCPQLKGVHNGMYGVSDNHPRARQVIRLSDGKIYPTITKCSVDNNLHFDTISMHCNGKMKNIKYMYLEDYEKENKIKCN